MSWVAIMMVYDLGVVLLGVALRSSWVLLELALWVVGEWCLGWMVWFSIVPFWHCLGSSSLVGLV